MFTCLIKVLPIEELNKIKDDPFAELQYFNVVRSYLDSEEFPYQRAWDLRTRKLHFYMTADEAKERRQGIDIGLVNKTFADQLKSSSEGEEESEGGGFVLLNQDYGYVANNIIKDNDYVNTLAYVTIMEPGTYAFVPEKKIYELVGQKLLQGLKD